MDLNKYPYVSEKVVFYHYADNDINAIILKGNGKQVSLSVKYDAFKILNMCNGEKSFNDLFNVIKDWYDIEISELIIFFKNSIRDGLIKVRDSQYSTPINIIGNGRKLFPYSASIELTDQCNLKCTYCYNESGPNKKPMPLNKIKILFDLLSKNGVNNVELTGGELMTHPNIYEVLELAFEKFNRISILSNGVYFPDALLKLINENKEKFVGVQISIDGSNEAINYKLRQVKNTFEKTISTIKKLLLNDIFVRVGIVLTEENIGDLRETCELMRKIGVKHFLLGIIKELGRGKELVANREIDNTKSYGLNLYKKYEKYINTIYDEFDDILDSKRLLSKFNLDSIDNCSAGRKSVTIKANGDVILCPTSNIILGNIFKDEYLLIFNSEANKILNKFSIKKYRDSLCKECSQREDCGVCFVRMYSANKRRLELSQGICEVVKQSGLNKVFNFS